MFDDDTRLRSSYWLVVDRKLTVTYSVFAQCSVAFCNTTCAPVLAVH